MRKSDTGTESGRLIKRRNVLRAGGFAAGITGAVGLESFEATAGSTERRGGTGGGNPNSHTFLCQNAWIIPEPVWDDVEKPAVEKDIRGIETPYNDVRARRLGSKLSYSHIDFVGFQEVFHEKHRAMIREPIQRDLEYAVGPRQRYEDASISSGLYHLTLGDRRILRSERTTYESRGSRRRDADAYANKGVLFTRIDLGDGVIDLFTTHLFAGGDWPGEAVDPSPVREPTPEPEYRRRQLEEFEAFVEDVKRRHDPDGKIPIVCAGDFNIAPGYPAYPELLEFRENLGLLDAWIEVHGEMVGGTGGTDITEGCDFDPWDRPPYYCEGSGERGGEASRVDHVFVEDRRDIKVEDIRRRVFWRELAPPGEFYADEGGELPNYLADHIGLEADFTFPS